MANPLETKQWLVDIDAETAQAYAIMRETEDGWLSACQEAGIDLHPIGVDRRCILAIKEGQKLPKYKKLLRTRAEYLERIQILAAEQGKEKTIGIRATEPPFWLGGGDLTTDAPTYKASTITWRTQTAYRAGKLDAQQALRYLKGRLSRQLEILENAEANYKKDRLDRINERVKELETAYREAEAFLSRNTSVLARVISGNALKITASGRDEEGKKVSYSSSLASIMLIPVADEYVYKEAPKRARGSTVEVMARFDNIEFYQIRLS